MQVFILPQEINVDCIEANTEKICLGYSTKANCDIATGNNRENQLVYCKL